MTVDLESGVEHVTSKRLARQTAGLVRPFGNATGVWAVACGVLAAGQAVPQRADLLPLLYLVLLVSLGWGASWRLIAEMDWFEPLRSGWPPRKPAMLPALPYTRRGSPAGRLWGGAGRVIGWWGEVFWPAAGGAVSGLAAAAVLAVVFSVLLSTQGGAVGDDVRRLSAAFVALAGVGLAWRRYGRDWLAGRAAVLVALPWLAGYGLARQLAAPVPVAQVPAAGALAAGPIWLALAFTSAAWGTERMARGLGGGGWLIGVAQAGVVALLVGAGEALAAGVVGLLLLAQVALVVGAAAGAEPETAARFARGWLLMAMLAAALGLP